MSKEEFKKYIESIGFKYIAQVYTTDTHYRYKNYQIDLYNNNYNFYNRSGWALNISLNNLKPLQKEFKNELRSIKLKKILE